MLVPAELGDNPDRERLRRALRRLRNEQKRRGDPPDVAEIARHVGRTKQTIYNWLYAFVLDRYDSLPTRWPPDRPAKLITAQRQQHRGRQR